MIKIKNCQYLQHWDVNNLYRWAMQQKLPVNNFELIENTSQFNEDFIKNYNEELHKQHNNLRYLPEIMKIEKVKKLLANLHGKIGVKLKYVIHMKSLKQSLNHELILKNSSLKPYIDMNTDLRKKNQNMIFFFISINDTIFEKTMENVENIGILNLSQQKEEKTIWCQNQIIKLQSFSQKIYQQQKMKKTERFMNKPV